MTEVIATADYKLTPATRPGLGWGITGHPNAVVTAPMVRTMCASRYATVRYCRGCVTERLVIAGIGLLVTIQYETPGFDLSEPGVFVYLDTAPGHPSSWPYSISFLLF
jgi:hypothetical protein